MTTVPAARQPGPDNASFGLQLGGRRIRRPSVPERLTQQVRVDVACVRARRRRHRGVVCVTLHAAHPGKTWASGRRRLDFLLIPEKVDTTRRISTYQ